MFEATLPSGKQVTFKAPMFEDRRSIVRKYDRNDGYLPEDLLAAQCLTHINGTPVEADWANPDPITVFYGWELPDQAFYMEVFMSMFGLDEKGKQNAQELAKKLMSGTATASSTQKAKAVKVSGGSLAV